MPNEAQETRYLSGTLVKVFVTKVYKDTGNTVQDYGAEAQEMWLEDCVAISWQTRQPKIPVYGHASHFYDAVMGGNVQVNGQIAMVLDYPSKFYNAIMTPQANAPRNPKSAFNMTEFHDLKTDATAGSFNIIIIYGNVPYEDILSMNLTNSTQDRKIYGERIVGVHIDGVSSTIAQDDNPLMKVLSFTAKRTETLNFDQAITSYSNRLFDVFNEQTLAPQQKIIATFSTMPTEMNVADASVQFEINEARNNLKEIARSAQVSLGLKDADPMFLIISIADDLGPYADYFKRQSTGEFTNIIAGDPTRKPKSSNLIWQGKYREIDEPAFEKLSYTLQRRLMSLNQ